MSYIAKNITGSDERIVYMTRLHWVYILSGTFWLITLLLAGIFLNRELWSHLIFHPPHGSYQIINLPVWMKYYSVTLFFGAGGVTIFLVHFLKVLATEIALTPQRIIYKAGWLFVEVEEIELNEIRAEHVHHGFLGRFLRYGSLHLDSRFVGDIYLPAIRKPYKFLQAIHKARVIK